MILHQSVGRRSIWFQNRQQGAPDFGLSYESQAKAASSRYSESAVPDSEANFPQCLRSSFLPLWRPLQWMSNPVYPCLNNHLVYLALFKRSLYISATWSNIFSVNLPERAAEWWRRRESNPRPKTYPQRLLHAFPAFYIFASSRSHRQDLLKASQNVVSRFCPSSISASLAR